MVKTYAPFGYEGAIVSVNIDLRGGIPAVDIVGVADSAVKDLRERVQAAFRNQKLDFPSECVLASFSPCDIKKEGAQLDLPFALGILEAMHLETDYSTPNVMVLGELDLSGDVRSVRAVTASLQEALASGIRYAIMPEASMDEEAVPGGMNVAWVKNLKEAFEALKDLAEGNVSKFISYSDTENAKDNSKIEFQGLYDGDSSLDDVEGLDGLKYAMTVAAAGRHHMLVVGGPGSGKTMMMQKFYQILPKLQEYEKPAVNRIHSIAGLPLRDTRPFRMPHQTASIEGICGGGTTCRPGEISLAHNGVLFLDEASEFRASVLQMLRVPLEMHSITLSRAGRSTIYPANFQLLVATLPCPCGNYGSKDKICLCSPRTISMFWTKFSAPLLDRVDIRYFMNEPVEYAPMTLEYMRTLVARAQHVQYKRQGCLNGNMTREQADKFITYATGAAEYLTQKAIDLGLSPRAAASIGRVARTIADMEENYSPQIRTEHIDKAMQLRKSAGIEEPVQS